MEEIDVMAIAYEIIPILRREKLTYNQAKKVLGCCEYLLGDECIVTRAAKSGAVQEFRDCVTQKGSTELYESTETFSTDG